MRNRHFLVLDLVLLAGLPFVALSLRFESVMWAPDVVHGVAIYATLVLPLRIAVAYAMGLYRCIWRHASISELERILFAGAVAALGSILVGTVGLTGKVSPRLGCLTRRSPWMRC